MDGTVTPNTGNSITFEDLKAQTAADCEQVAEFLRDLAVKVRGGDTVAFEQFWYEGGTEEGDAKILEMRERLCVRYFYRQERVDRSVGVTTDGE